LSLTLVGMVLFKKKLSRSGEVCAAGLKSFVDYQQPAKHI